MCGATSEQKDAAAQSALLSKEMAADFATTFKENQAILGSLKTALEPIISAGPNQEGFSAPELAALRGQATDLTAQAANSAEIASGAKAAAAGGGREAIPSGAQMQIDAMINNSAGQNLANEQRQITTQDYQTGRENFFKAEGDLASAPGQLENPATAAGSAATNSATSAMDAATQIQQADDSWMGPVFGMLGSLGGAALGRKW